jgi:hypothetical protein
MDRTFDAAFPGDLRSQAKAAVSVLNLSTDYYVGDFSVSVLGETMVIPRRVHCPSITPDLSRLPLQQRQMAQCILTRSTDGFKRQAALKEVLPINEPWSIPFVIALVGEYVIEIIDDIYVAAPKFDREVVATFIGENSAFYKVICDRVMSYWNCYYRWQFQRDDYVGFKLLRELDTQAQSRLVTTPTAMTPT